MSFLSPENFLFNSKMKIGEINWRPEIPDGEDIQTLAKNQEDMKKEHKKASPDVNFIKQRMDLTFAQRREYINSNPPIADLKERCACLLTVRETGNEFYRLTAKELHQSFKTSLLKVAPDIVTFVKCSKKGSSWTLDMSGTLWRKAIRVTED